MKPALFDENNSLFEEVFEDVLQALGFRRERFENPCSIRSLAGPDFKGLRFCTDLLQSQSCSENLVGWVFQAPLPCPTLRASPWEGRVSSLFRVNIFSTSWTGVICKEYQYEDAEFACELKQQTTDRHLCRPALVLLMTAPRREGLTA